MGQDRLGVCTQVGFNKGNARFIARRFNTKDQHRRRVYATCFLHKHQRHVRPSTQLQKQSFRMGPELKRFKKKYDHT
jgi:hypothetical protein